MTSKLTRRLFRKWIQSTIENYGPGSDNALISFLWLILLGGGIAFTLVFGVLSVTVMGRGI